MGVAGGFRTPLLVPKSMNAQVPCVKWCSTVGLSICRRPIHGFHQLHLQMQDLQMWRACCVQLSFLSVFLYLGSCCLYCCSLAKLCPTLCDPMDCSTPGFPVLNCLLEFAQTLVHWVSDAIPCMDTPQFVYWLIDYWLLEDILIVSICWQLWLKVPWILVYRCLCGWKISAHSGKYI